MLAGMFRVLSTAGLIYIYICHVSVLDYSVISSYEARSRAPNGPYVVSVGTKKRPAGIFGKVTAARKFG